MSGSDFDLRVLSLGAGVQSSCMALMAASGEIEPPDFCLFADTQWEGRATYEWLAKLEEWLPFPVVRVTHGDIRSKRGAGRMPWYISNDGTRGILSRACTSRFKIDPMAKYLKARIDWKNGERVEKLLGITTDEAHRMKTSRERWEHLSYPLIDLRMRRGDCIEWMRSHGYPDPPKSACIGCPFKRDTLWLHLKNNYPDEFEDACRFEEEFGGVVAKHPAFLHDSITPLRDVEFKNEHQPDLFGQDCDGLCGV